MAAVLIFIVQLLCLLGFGRAVLDVPVTCDCLASHTDDGSSTSGSHGFNELRVLESQLFGEAVLNVSNACLQFQNDVYQRFSGYVAKHRMARLCSSALEVFERFRHIVMGSPACPCTLEQDFAAQGTSFLQALTRYGGELERMLQDTNGYGDGSFHQLIMHHFDRLSQHILQALDVRASKERQVAWEQELPNLLDSMMQLVTASFDEAQEGITYNIASLSLEKDLETFLRSLDGFPATVRVLLRRTAGADPHGLCRDVLPVYKPQQVFDQIIDPKDWKNADVSGMLATHPSTQKLLFKLARSLPLSYNYVAVAPRALIGEQELTAEYRQMFHQTGGRSAPAMNMSPLQRELSCTGTGLAFSPAHCLFDLGWGSITFSLGMEPPFDGVLAVQEMSLRADRPRPFVQPVANGSLSMHDLFEHVDSVYKSLNTPSPDLLYLSPMVGNCLTLLQLGPSRREGGPGGPPHLTPKLVMVPINPLIPPPVLLAPNFTAWYETKLDAGHRPHEAEWWLAQCSVAAAADVMQAQGYQLLHIEHSYAVFILKGVWPAVQDMLSSLGTRRSSSATAKMEATEDSEHIMTLHEMWLEGWYCSPLSATLFALEPSCEMDLSLLYDSAAEPSLQQLEVCRFSKWFGLPLTSSHSLDCQGVESWASPVQGLSHQFLPQSQLVDPTDEPGKAYMLESSGRGRCLSHLGFCECFPPYRGSFCQSSEPGKHPERAYRGVLHYLVGDRERLLNDFVKTLPLLWKQFNEKFDYPVVVFHDGLKASSRERILQASRNRIWFAYVEDYTAVPSTLQNRLELDLGGYSLGYRGMCRFRSGPMFTHPVMANFDYAWTLDTDGYFPASIDFDPFKLMWEGDYIYAYSHISRDQASAVQHFWEFCRLYLSMKGLDPKGTKMMRRLTDALVLRDTFWHEWNRVLFMNDIEMVKLDWFRDELYQDFFRFLDSVGGFWLYRWGDHAVRTIAIALFVEPSKLMKMRVPYGHQETCRCGEQHPDQVCLRESPREWWHCEPAASHGDPHSGADPGGHDIGTLDDSLIFGGS